MFLLFRTKDDLPAYNSGDEELDECALCKETVDDPIKFGENDYSWKVQSTLFLLCKCEFSIQIDLIGKQNSSNIYFQLISANLPQRDDENNASRGYRESDLKLEVQRASRLVNTYFMQWQHAFSTSWNIFCQLYFAIIYF